MIDLIYKDFLSWLQGLIEDDPIPYEIKSLIFYINKNFEIGFFGSEKEKIDVIEKDMFFPLEAEYFFNKSLYELIFSSKNKENKSILILKTLLLKLKKEKYFSIFNIYYGFLFQKSKKISNKL